MQDLLRQIFKELFQIASTEGVRFVRVQTLSFFIRIIQGIRRIFLLNYVIMIFCFLNAFSFFYSLYFISVQISETRTLILTWPLGVCAVLFFLTFIVLALTIREKTWIKMFRIEELVDSATETPGPCSSKEIDTEEIERIVEKILKTKFQTIPQRKSKKKR